jgi:hypothetical protein
MLDVGFDAVSGAMHVVAAGVAAVMVVADLKQLLVTNLLDPAVQIFQVLALFFGVMAGVHAIAAHHGGVGGVAAGQAGAAHDLGRGLPRRAQERRQPDGRRRDHALTSGRDDTMRSLALGVVAILGCIVVPLLHATPVAAAPAPAPATLSSAGPAQGLVVPTPGACAPGEAQGQQSGLSQFFDGVVGGIPVIGSVSKVVGLVGTVMGTPRSWLCC